MENKQKIQRTSVFSEQTMFLEFIKQINSDLPTREKLDEASIRKFGVPFEYISYEDIALKVSVDANYPALGYDFECNFKDAQKKQPHLVHPLELTPKDRMDYKRNFLDYYQNKVVYNFYTANTLFGKKTYMKISDEPSERRKRDFTFNSKISNLRPEWIKQCNIDDYLKYYTDKTKRYSPGFLVSIYGTKGTIIDANNRYDYLDTIYDSDIVNNYVRRMLQIEVFGKSDIKDLTELKKVEWCPFFKDYYHNESRAFGKERKAIRLISNIEYHRVQGHDMIIDNVSMKDRNRLIAKALLCSGMEEVKDVEMTYSEFIKLNPNADIVNKPHIFEF
jgi:hypothetical protein